MSREYTNKLIDLCEEGILTKEDIFNEMMKYFSEDTIKEFCLTSFGNEIHYLFEGVLKNE